MRTFNTLKLTFASLAMLFFTQISAQTFNATPKSSSIIVAGTSNIHDWEVTAEDFKGSLSVTMDDGQLVKIGKLEFTVPTEALKSGKGQMDKNTYKALKSDKYKNITYTVEKVNNLDCISASKCKIATSGQLTIAGTKNPVEIIFDAQVAANKIVLTGSKELKMTDFKVDPPKAMFGTITTGDAVTIKFETAFIK